MFVISQNGEHTVNMDAVEEIVIDYHDRFIMARFMSGCNRVLASYKNTKDLGRDMADLISHYEEGKKVYMFPEEGGSDE